MKIAFLISGFMRTILYNISKNITLFEKYDIDYYIHISNNETKVDDYCSDNIDYKKIINILQPIKIIYENELEIKQDAFTNLKRMWYKIYILNQSKKLYEKNNNFIYDKVVRFRPDIYILDNTLSFKNVQDNIIYGNNDEFFYGTSNTMNTFLNLFEDFDTIVEKIAINNNYKKNKTIFNYYIQQYNFNLENHNIDYKLVLTLCNIIAICGNSGSGKTKLMNELSILFQENILQLEGDRYHKWERNSKNWLQYTHLNPSANHISKFNNDIYNLKIGHHIYQVDYDHTKGKFTEVQKIKNKKNIILCGLHTLYDKNVNKLLDLKIYLDTDIKLRYYWKIKRDTKQRGYDARTVIEYINKRKPDAKKYIHPQKYNSDLIITFFTDDNFNYKYYIEPNIYLRLEINKNYDIEIFLSYINKYYIYYQFINNNNKYILVFKEISPFFIDIFNELILDNSINKLSTQDLKNNLSYYTIIRSLILYLKNNKLCNKNIK